MISIKAGPNYHDGASWGPFELFVQRKPLTMAVFAVIAAIYFVGLDYSPVYLINDEVNAALQAYSLATTGRSRAGDFLPVHFREPEFPAGRDPLSIYTTALTLKVLPFSEATIRSSTAAVGVMGLALMYMAAARLFRSAAAGASAALLLATTPAYFIHSRLGLPVLWPIPFVLGWLWLLARFVHTRNPTVLFLSASLLGASSFAYLGSAVVAPIFLVATLVWLYASGERRPRCYVMLLVGFVIPVLLQLYAQAVRPTRYSDLLHYYDTEGGPRLPRPWKNFAAWQQRLSTYWNYFNPNFLFIAGDGNPRYSTNHVGVFALSLAALLPLGVRRITTIARGGLGYLVIGCFVATPVVASLFGGVEIKRVLPMLVFAVLISAAGLERLLGDSRQWLRATGLVLLLAIPAEFVLFTIDYFGHYRLRSGYSRGGNLRGALVRAMKEAELRPERRIFLSTSIPNARIYWDFYALAEHRDQIVGRVSLIDPSGLDLASPTPRNDSIVPSGSLLVAGTAEMPPLSSTSWGIVDRIYELDGPTFYTIYERR